MMALPANTRIWIAAGVTDLRRGFTGLSALVETTLEQKPFSGQAFVFRGRRGDLIKVLWYDGDGLCLFAKRLERGRFVWPQATSGTVSLTRAQLSVDSIHRDLCDLRFDVLNSAKIQHFLSLSNAACVRTGEGSSC
jgi:transposase